ncbi:hypothetical protein BL250_11255 [Erwinia sp. OLTSP20]|uniref:peroxide/acid stress response protein YhcN n=1 Tax=unclassified Erwinia TaxID=2622719 RepID=UPI000C19D762|nr:MULTISPECIES: peroxide/acid stress response protein YhcN [unclassified Erwinia]PIJ51069.1 hypothetical protein BV501_06105 [Erwinia sp. OAMSP11]PIJ73663.1 hypothetical protein BK416_05995 [Erwinia sp. OLSSP12]PIJ83020.1 hypothetical protein BLD47_05490 [Erwinia sp. OLCASP19]PIJ85619.1 hypothetical protein BLD46_05520 [Erwinia sp. OLMTSP26]PIJ87732.1 hypothetical protein BLD49_05595 [Erwinia sp. OLMDSP33]
MRITTTIATVSLLSVLSFSIFAADSVSSEQARNLHPAGVVSVSVVGGSPMDLHSALDSKAAAQGASAYRVIEAREAGNWHATAELYR